MKMRNISINDEILYVRFVIPTEHRKCIVMGVTMNGNKKGANICRSKSTGLYYAAPGCLTTQTKNTKYYETDYDAAFYYHHDNK